MILTIRQNLYPTLIKYNYNNSLSEVTTRPLYIHIHTPRVEWTVSIRFGPAVARFISLRFLLWTRIMTELDPDWPGSWCFRELWGDDLCFVNAMLNCLAFVLWESWVALLAKNIWAAFPCFLSLTSIVFMFLYISFIKPDVCICTYLLHLLHNYWNVTYSLTCKT